MEKALLELSIQSHLLRATLWLRLAESVLYLGGAWAALSRLHLRLSNLLQSRVDAHLDFLRNCYPEETSE